MKIISFYISVWSALLAWAPSAAADPTFIPIEISDAELMVQPAAIANDGFLCGTYVDTNFNSYAFTRAADGTITTFQVPGGNPTGCTDVNDKHDLVGQYAAGNPPGSVGYMRSSKGRFSTIAVTNAPYTFVSGINAHRYVSGVYEDFTVHVVGGFIWNPQGGIETFNVPGTYLSVGGINKNGAIAGAFTMGLGNDYGFIRQLDGSLTTFDVHHDEYVSSRSINDHGLVAGSAEDPDTLDTFGFLRRPHGKVKTFSGSDQRETFVTGLNNHDDIVGTFGTCNGPGSHGFCRSRDGNITLIDYPGKSCTELTGINDAGVIIGYYEDAAGDHGFLRTP